MAAIILVKKENIEHLLAKITPALQANQRQTPIMIIIKALGSESSNRQLAGFVLDCLSSASVKSGPDRITN